MNSADLDPLPLRQRAAAASRAALGVLAADTALLTAYAVVPVDPQRGAAAPLLRLTAMLAVFAVVVLWQVYSISRARFPGIRGAAAVGFVVPLFLTVFATVYHLQSFVAPDAFSEPLSRLDALYFTVTVFTTVGFGDIVPLTATARAFVMVQMLLNLVVLGGVLRLLFSAARSVRQTRDADGPPPPA